MSGGREPWFEYDRPRAGELNARPVHPVGWAILFGAPLPSLLLGHILSETAGKPVGFAVAMIALPVAPFAIFRLVVARGGPAR